MSDEKSDRSPDGMSDRMPDRMSEYTSDRMSFGGDHLKKEIV